MINKEKCGEFAKTLCKTLKLTQELTYDDFEYIEAQFSMAFAKRKLEELEAKDE